jgi:hypothetical protein
MRKGVVAVALLGVVACGSSAGGTSEIKSEGGTSDINSEGGTSGLAKFTGSEWTGTETDIQTCGASSKTYTGTWLVAFEPNGASGIKYTSEDGCIFEFNVVGDTATLSDGPVMCTAKLEAGTDVSIFNTYTVSTSNGSTLSGAQTSTSTLDGLSCSYKETITATR